MLGQTQDEQDEGRSKAVTHTRADQSKRMIFDLGVLVPRLLSSEINEYCR
jgi:hypothetical protein